MPDAAGRTARDPAPIVVVGAGQAGAAVIATLRSEGCGVPLVLIGAEAHAPYERPPLSKAVLAGSMPPEQCSVWKEAPPPAVEMLRNVRASSIDRARREVRLSDGRVVAYRDLVLATGGRARRLAVPGGELCHYLRTLDDALGLRAALASARRLAVIGGGWIGLEVAATARQRGLEVVVLEAQPSLCARAAPDAIGEALLALHRDAGVDVRLGAAVRSLERVGEGVRLDLADGANLEVDLAVAGVGLELEVSLARDAGLALDDGIVVDAFGRTGDPHVYATGDVARYPASDGARALRLESWSHAQRHGASVARAILGRARPYAEIPWFWSDQFDVNVQVLGAPCTWGRAVVRGDAASRRFSLFYLDATGRLQGAAALNAGRDIAVARRLMARGVVLSPADLTDTRVKLDRLLPRE